MRLSSTITIAALLLCSGAAQSRDITAKQGRVTSAYTDLNLRRCRSLTYQQEGESASWRCPGYRGVPLFVLTGDGRYDIDAGRDNGTWESVPPFNDFGPRVEWRLRGGRPFAIIYRLSLAQDENSEWSRSVLGVETVGGNRPGCLIAWVDAATPDANAVARREADQRGSSFRCGRDEPRLIRNAAPELR